MCKEVYITYFDLLGFKKFIDNKQTDILKMKIKSK